MDKIEFTTAERETLHYWRFHYPHPRVQRKMEALYLKSQGLAPAEIRRLCAMSTTTFYRYLHEYHEGGIEKLQEVPFRGAGVSWRTTARVLKRTCGSVSPPVWPRLPRGLQT